MKKSPNSNPEPGPVSGQKRERALTVEELVDLTKRIRRMLILTVGRAGCGHLGGSLSAAEVLTALYFHMLRIDPSDPQWEDRDRFVLSKGHNTPLYYTVLALRGYFPVEWLDTYDCVDSRLQGHPDMTKTPGVDMTTGSLGQGFSSALGMSIAGRLLKKNYRVFVMIGDGEFQEGQVWEAIMYAGARRLDNLICIMDHNKLQLASTIDEGLPIAPVAPKFEAFGWNVIEIDGHDMTQVIDGLDRAASHRGGPVAVISHTLKGKGVSFMEQVVKWHSSPPTRQEVLQALQELDATEEELAEWR
jgi:transketolase